MGQAVEWDRRGLGEFCKLIYQLRKDKGVPRVRVADARNSSTQTIWKLENRETYPTRLVGQRLAEFYGVPVGQLEATLPQGFRENRVKRGRSTKGWPVGQRFFGNMLARWKNEAEVSMDMVYLKTQVSIGLLYQLARGNARIPKDATIIKLCKAFKKKPRKMLLLRAISHAHPSLRLDLLKAMMPDEKVLIGQQEEENALYE